MRNPCSESDCERLAYGRGLCSLHYQLARYHGDLPTHPPARQCAQCGQTFQGRKFNARYCSRSCNDQARYERTRKPPRRQTTCDQCGGSLNGRRTQARFCSETCGQTWRNAQTAAQTLEAKGNRPPCVGCGGLVPAERTRTARYCSNECKIRSHRHEAYGLTKAELDLLLDQHDRCAICGSHNWGKKGPQVDHCHTTGTVRGVLCINCNNGLGRFADDPARLRAAADYLERTPA